MGSAKSFISKSPLKNIILIEGTYYLRLSITTTDIRIYVDAAFRQVDSSKPPTGSFKLLVSPSDLASPTRSTANTSDDP